MKRPGKGRSAGGVRSGWGSRKSGRRAGREGREGIDAWGECRRGGKGERERRTRGREVRKEGGRGKIREGERARENEGGMFMNT